MKNSLKSRTTAGFLNFETVHDSTDKPTCISSHKEVEEELHWS